MLGVSTSRVDLARMVKTLTQGQRINCQDRRCYQFWKRNRMRWRHLDKLLKGKLAVHVLVHLPEDLVRSLFWRRLVFGHLQHRTNLKLCHVNFDDFNGQPFGLMWKR